MAEDRMLSDEILLGLIKKNGGSGGTTDYEALENLPEINGVELKGNMSLSDLGIASAQSVSDITNGESINNFAGVETALGNKQGKLTAGDYIDITNDEISVNREIPSVIAEYEIKTEPMVEGQAFISVTKTVNGEVVLTQKYGSSTAGINQGINFDENIYVDYSKTASWSWTYKLRNASVDHAANYTQSWNYGSTVDYTEEFIVTDHSGDKLVIKSEMDTAMAEKADTDMVAADFNAGTSYTAGNYCVQDGKLYKFKNNHSGAWSAADVDEVKITGELSALKNGLINQTARSRSNITSRLTNLATAVAEQNLEKYGYKIGDYFTGASGYIYHLADMDTFYGDYNNNAIVNTHHISLVVKTGANSKWAETNDTSGGYKTSTLHSFLSSTVLDNIKSDMIALFGGSTGLEHLVSHKLLWTTATSGAWEWSDNAEYISALSEPQVYGTNVWAIDGNQTGEAWKWLEIFHKFNFCEILGNIWWWLRSISSASAACGASCAGDAGNSGASSSAGAVGLIIFH